MITDGQGDVRLSLKVHRADGTVEEVEVNLESEEGLDGRDDLAE